MPNPGRDAEDAWTRLDQRAVIAPSCRVLYVPTPKVLSTAMLWLLARAEGDPDSLTRASVIGPTPALTIHDPAVHRLATLGQLDGATTAEVLGSDRWVRLGVTRDPYARLVSSWQHSVLLGTPGPLQFDAPDLVTDAAGDVDLGASFRAFVGFLREHWDAVVVNQHFLRQTDCLRPDLVDYTDLPTTHEVEETLDRLARHAPPLRGGLEQTNEGLGIDHRRCYDAATAATVEQLYAADFEQFGYPPMSASRSAEPLLLDQTGVRLLRAVRQRNERIDLLRKGIGPRWELERQRTAARSAIRRVRARWAR